jgi:hypothetical protein
MGLPEQLSPAACWKSPLLLLLQLLLGLSCGHPTRPPLLLLLLLSFLLLGLSCCQPIGPPLLLLGLLMLLLLASLLLPGLPCW